MTVYLAAASLVDINPLLETGLPGQTQTDTTTGTTIPSAYGGNDPNSIRMKIYGNNRFDWLLGDSPIALDATPKFIHYWWDYASLQSAGGENTADSNNFAAFSSAGNRIFNLSVMQLGMYLRVYDTAGTVIFDDYTTNFAGRDWYAPNQINIKITGGSTGNVTIWENETIIANVNIPSNMHSDMARATINHLDAYASWTYYDEILVADFDTRGARVKHLTLAAATTNTASAATVEANARTHIGTYTTVAGKNGIVFDVAGQKVLYGADSAYAKDTGTSIVEVRYRAYANAETGTAVTTITPIFTLSATEYAQANITPAAALLALTPQVSVPLSPATSNAWLESEIQALGFGLEA